MHGGMEVKGTRTGTRFVITQQRPAPGHEARVNNGTNNYYMNGLPYGLAGNALKVFNQAVLHNNNVGNVKS